MTSDFTGFNFLQAAINPMSDIRRGYGQGDAASPDIRRGYEMGGAATPASTIGSASTVDTTQHTTSAYLALPQS